VHFELLFKPKLWKEN